MPDDRAERLAELVKSAIERGPKQWSAFLDKECGSDAAMRIEIESLLAHHEQGSRFIEEPALHLAAESFVRGGANRVGQIVGDYEILSLIGSGGMGEVYLAQDQRLQRRAALKLVRGGMDSDDVLRRFKREELLLASLNHANIAPLYGSGVTADGIPFFAMEFVEGMRIDEYCRRKEISIQMRLELFRKVCGAIHYAHQHLVVHRDIKPSNILVTAEGEPKLLDFGIAKLVDANPSFTLTEMKALTPEYASPEQVKGENVTTATDVYSLGVVLYELLTGQRPYRLKTSRPDELSRVICEEEPARPSMAAGKNQTSNIEERTQKFLRGDLDNIVLMALRKEPARRYGSVAQFSEDIRRHLVGLPVIARKDTWSYRSGKFVQRHKVGVAAAALVFLAIVTGMVATLREKNRAERRFSDVRHLANALLVDIAPKIERLPGSTEARQVILTQSLKYLDSLAAEGGDDRNLQNELAAAYEKVGDLQGNPTNANLTALSDALVSYQKAGVMRRALLEKNPRDFEERSRLANNYKVLGDIYWQTGESAQSLKNSERALSLYTELLDEKPDSDKTRLALARTNHDIGSTLEMNENYASAIPYLKKAIASGENLRRRFPDRLDVVTLLANSYRELGYALSWENQQKAGEAEMVKALEIFEKVAASHPQDTTLAADLFKTYLIASSTFEEIDNPLSNEFAFKALALAERIAANDPANLGAQQELAKACSRAGVTLKNIGRSAESIDYLKRAVAILETLARSEAKNRRFKRDLATALTRLGDALQDEHRSAEALEASGKAAATLTELVRANDKDNGCLRNLANVNNSIARMHKAIAAASTGEQQHDHRELMRRHFQQALEMYRRLAARDALSAYDRKTLQAMERSKEDYQ